MWRLFYDLHLTPGEMAALTNLLYSDYDPVWVGNEESVKSLKRKVDDLLFRHVPIEIKKGDKGET